MHDAVIVNQLLERYRADKEGSGTQSIEAYQALFPGYEELIAREFADLKRREAAQDDDEADQFPLPPATFTTPRSNERPVGPYRILREIARGGQATVYLAEDARLHREVALKVLEPGHGIDTGRLDRFRREAEITSKLNNPGICPVFETGEDRGVLWIAMAYVDGEPLSAKIATDRHHAASHSTSVVEIPDSSGRGETEPPARREAEPPTGPKTWTEIARVLRFFEDAARVMHVAHDQGVLHRDIKPGNIMVTNDGLPVILDFGLAQDVGRDLPSLTLTGDFLGTPAYMSPEQLMAQRNGLDRRTDVYSLGVSLFECLTLRRPFEAPTREALYQAILTREASDLRSLNPTVPSDLRVVVATAIEKDRDRRYQTALDFAEELRRVRMHEPILAKPVGQLVRLQRWAQRKPGLATALGGVFVALIVSVFLLFRVTSERDAKDTALSEKTAALTDYDRLGDFSRLQKLVAGADKLWPAEPSNVAAMNSWLDQASDLEKRLAGHREVRDRLRASAALPYTDADRDADLRDHAAGQKQVAKLRDAREEIAAVVAARSGIDAVLPESSRAAWSGFSLADLRTGVANYDAEIQRLDARINERLTWKFESSAEQFKHDTTAKLVADLTAFVDPDPHKGLLADVRGRLVFAESVQQETIGKFETKWADAIKSIADDSPKYHGLEIRAQVGLIPIGKDPASGLWEFAHLQTTAPGTDPIPKRDKDGKLVVTESMGIVFVLIPGGTFMMGAVKADEDQAPTEPNVDPEALDDESPITEVPLDPFFLSKYEMTQGQWLRLVGNNPSHYGRGATFGGKVVDLRHPVERVTNEDCDLWLGRLGLLLPTEAQWEYGARGGTTTPRWTGIGTDGLANAANLADEFCRQNSGPQHWKYEPWDDGYTAHAPVGSFAANPFGLHDVLGNVWEWCRDRFCTYEVKPRAGDGMRSPSHFIPLVARGGGFDCDASHARSAHRGRNTPDFRSNNIGVRPARNASNP